MREKHNDTVRVLNPSSSDKLLAPKKKAEEVAAPSGSLAVNAPTLEDELAAMTIDDMITKHASREWGEGSGLTTLMLACRIGKLDFVEALLDAKADVHARTSRKGQS